MRRSAAAVAIVVVTIVLPYFLAVAAVVPLGAADWLLRITPAAGFAVQQAVSAVSAGQRHLLGPVGLLPARRWTGLGGAVRLDGGGAGRSGRAAAPPGRLMQGGRAGAPAGLARPGGRRTALPDALHAEWTKLRTLSSTWWLCGRGRAHHRGGRGRGRGRPLRAGRMRAGPDRRGPGEDQPVRRLPRPGDRRAAGRARGRRRVRHRDDPGDAGRDATAAGDAGRQGGGGHRLGGGRRHGRRARLGAGRAADPARPGPVRGERLCAGVAGQRPRPARRGRLGGVPGADRAAGPGHHHGGPRLRRGHRPGARRAVPVPDRQLGDPGPGAVPPPGADRPDDRGPVHPGHGRRAGPAAGPVAGSRRARRLGGRRDDRPAACCCACATPDAGMP